MGDDNQELPSGIGPWTAIVLAGSRPGVDPLCTAFEVATKAEVPIGDRPMVDWVCDALLRCPAVGRILILTQTPERLKALANAPSLQNPRVHIDRSRDGIARSILAYAGGRQAPWPVLVTTADHPLLTPDMLTYFLEHTGVDDLAIGAVKQSVVLAAAPNADRTWLRFADGGFSGANLFALKGKRTQQALNFWADAEVDRKRTLKIFMRFGPALAIQTIMRQLTFVDAIRRAGARLGLSGRLVSLPYANAAIDVDKLSDHRQVEALLEESTASTKLLPRTGDGISIFDLDRTLTRRGTYTALLIHAAVRLSPLRLALAPLVIAAMVAYSLRLISRRQVKEIEHRLLLGTVHRFDIDRVSETFAARLQSRNGFFADGINQIARERNDRRRVVLATAANRFYVEAIARALNIQPDEIVSTESKWDGPYLLPRIVGENCYGSAKRDMIATYMKDRGERRRDLNLRFFTDHVSDLATLEWADDPIVVNPARRLRRIANSRGWSIVNWR